MKSNKWICGLMALVFSLSTLAAVGNPQGRGQGRGKGQGRGQGEQGEGRGKGREKQAFRRYYSDRNRNELMVWYRGHESNLPPGLAKRDRLPPGLERQLIVNGTLPPGLRREIHPIPPEIVGYLPAPPPGTGHVLIGGQIVLMNRSTYMVLDILKLF